MIDSEEQYLEAKKQVLYLEEYLQSLKAGVIPAHTPKRVNDPRFRAIYEGSTRSMLEEFQQEIAQFEARKSITNFARSPAREPELA